MKKIRFVLALLTFLVGSASSLARDAAPAAIQSLPAWTNQSGSTLYIDSVSPSGQISGQYINRALGFACQNTPYPVTGWAYGTAITFTVNWVNATESCNSVTAWTGYYYQGAITTLWQLVSNGATDPSQIIQGKDVFQPGSAQKKSPALRNK